MSKRNHTIVERERILAEYKASGKTQKEFCLGANIKPNTLSHWLNNASKKPKPLKFMSLGEVKPVLGLAEIILPNAIKIRLPIEAEKISVIAQELLACE